MAASSAVDFTDPIDGKLDMGEYLAENAYGVGFRYLIARRYGMKTGIDLAFSEEDTALYFQVEMGI
ncbi:MULTISPECIES: hypothetical protein [Aliivibrio]|uniref:hypothetical protein n=1 Tax=Aliivibrio TaxID=511678 RepID=UPI00080D9365|nr:MULTISPECIES: hypothetical protein [Aliivibrio]MBD1568463.1 hypothetical protein [Aliivibrio sp. S10_S31]OCH08215.1 hypothetical protein A6E09_16950 [Aliivibrio fischeri]OCH25766.1 hypothetical protein A6E12_02140 [Aliivibrio fischeri]